MIPALFLAFALLLRQSLAHLESHHFPGYGFSWYDPVCGFACNNAIAGAPLSCTSTLDQAEMSMSTSPECYAGSTAYLTTLAYCMNSTCDSSKVPIWQRERFWATKVTGDAAVIPKWDYSSSLEQIRVTPTLLFNSSSKAVLNQTMLVGKDTYEIQSRFMVMFEYLESLQPRYIFVLLAIGVGSPVFFTLFARLPLVIGIVEQIKPYLIHPTAIGSRHVRPIPWILGNSPTIGQALWIAMFFILNLILSAVNYSRSQPHPWGFSPREETLAYIGYRTGHIAYALLPLLILLAGRNNFLLWITDWSYSTYLILHRWVARIFVLQAIVHSITMLMTYKGTGSYTTDSMQAYWQWGIVATVLACAILILSHAYLRRLAYEIFLGLHILLTVLIIIGCWYHAVLQFGHNFYENWLFAACAVWSFDRLLRLIRVVSNGIRFATVTDVGHHHVRIDVPGVRWASKPGHIAYVYFPMLNPLRPWENHPFSANSTSLFRSYEHTVAMAPTPPEIASLDIGQDEEKLTNNMVRAKEIHDATAALGTAGMTFIVKKSAGGTRLLRPHAKILTLVEGPYPHNPSSSIVDCDRVLLIGGGIGITGLLAWTRAHPNVKLAWSVKSNADALVQEMDAVLRNVVDKEVIIGDRLDIEALLRGEAWAGYGKVGVVVCGPGGMCDDVRAAVAGIGRGADTVFELEIDAFSW